MTQELFVVYVLKESAWVDAAEFSDETAAVMKCCELRASQLDANVVCRWVGSMTSFLQRPRTE